MPETSSLRNGKKYFVHSDKMEISYCVVCATEFIKKTDTHDTCPSKECRKKAAEKKKWIKSKEQAVKIQRDASQKSSKEFRATGAIKKAIIADMMAECGHAYCELCGPAQRVADLELHHILYRSEVPSHPKKHSRINTVLLCRECHEWLHKRKDNRNVLIVERKLWEAFPEYLREEAYS
jgi:hypothetical protein